MKPPSPIFLERRAYRLRRTKDAAVILPLAALVAMALPILWGGGGTRGGTLFIFILWFLIIVVAGILAQRLGGVAQADEETSEDGQ